MHVYDHADIFRNMSKHTYNCTNTFKNKLTHTYIHIRLETSWHIRIIIHICLEMGWHIYITIHTRLEASRHIHIKIRMLLSTCQPIYITILKATRQEHIHSCNMHTHTYNTHDHTYISTYLLTYLFIIHRFVSHCIIKTTKLMGLKIHHQDLTQAPFLPRLPKIHLTIHTHSSPWAHLTHFFLNCSKIWQYSLKHVNIVILTFKLENFGN